MNAITPFALAYAPVLRKLAAQQGTEAALDLADLAKACGKVPSNLRRDLPKLRAQGLLTDGEPLQLGIGGRAVLMALDGAAGGTDGQANAVHEGVALPAAEGAVGILHHLIVPDPLNPRKDFEDDEPEEGDLDQLAASILAKGILQNLLVRPAAPMDGYDQPVHRLVAGERRWRRVALLIQRGDWAADRLVPCVVREMTDAEHAELALIENLQRKNLKPLEEARAFRRLVDDHGVKTADIASRIGMTQRLVQQRLQLLDLDEEDQARLDAETLSLEEARRIAAKPKPEAVVLTDGERRAMAELLHKWKHAPKRKDSYYDETEVRHDALDKDQGLRRLKNLRWIEVVTETFNSERTFARRSYGWPDKATIAAFDLPDVADGTAIYFTSALNGPFPIPKEGKKRLAEKSQLGAKTRAANKIAKERATKLAADVDQLVTGALPAMFDPAAEFAALMLRAGSGYPWALTDNGGVRADGKDYGVGVNLYGVDKSLTQLLVYAVNRAGEPAAEAAKPAPTCNHIFGISIIDRAILKAMFELLLGDLDTTLEDIAERAGWPATDVETLRLRLVGDDDLSPAALRLAEPSVRA
jgi:ParB/RepB/Spo0J family partition protein